MDKSLGQRVWRAHELAPHRVRTFKLSRDQHLIEKLIGARTPAELDLHLITENYNTHKHPNVKTWLDRHPRFHLQFVPTSSLCLDPGAPGSSVGSARSPLWH